MSFFFVEILLPLLSSVSLPVSSTPNQVIGFYREVSVRRDSLFVNDEVFSLRN